MRLSGFIRRKNRWRIVIRAARGLGIGTNLLDYGATWSYKAESHDHDPGFEAPAFDDSSWATGPGGFGWNDLTSTAPPVVATRDANNAQIGTLWEDPTPVAAANPSSYSDMTLRNSITIPAGTTYLRLRYGIDDEVWFYIDGVEVAHFQNHGPSKRDDFFINLPWTGGAGTFVFAVRARNKIPNPHFPLASNPCFFDVAVDAYDGDPEGDRRPGATTVVVTNAQNVGVGEYYNSAGEIHFTLPTLDPQVPFIRPWQDHWAFEVFEGEAWREKSAGWIIDYDTTENDTIFYGVDYLGVLALLYDERFNPTASPDATASLWPEDPARYPDIATSGSKYDGNTITEIITDQIDRAINGPNSPVGFFTRGYVATSMTETITIFCTLTQRLSFITGLLDSHKAGTGVRTRIRVRKTIDGAYQFIVEDNPGENRNDLKLKYGKGLIQGYRVIPFGNFATRILGLGRVTNGLELQYTIASVTGLDGNPAEDTYGRLPDVRLWTDITDLNDLKRRAKQLAFTAGAIGKRVGLGLVTNMFAIKDGWDITDSVPIDIRRGGLDTTQMGNGYWTIWGWTLRINNTTEDSVTLSLLPKLDESDPDAGTSTTDPAGSATPTIVVSDGPPDADNPAPGPGTHIDTTTGDVWVVDPATGYWVNTTAEGGPSFPAAGDTVSSEVPFDITPDAGVATFLSRADHTHGSEPHELPTGGTVGQVLGKVDGTDYNVEWGGGGVTMIQDILLGADAATIDFSSIPATYSHLEIRALLRGATAATDVWVQVTINGDTGANYDNQELQGYIGGTSAAWAESLGDTKMAYMVLMPAASSPSGSAAAAQIEVPDYAGTAFHKTLIGSSVARIDTGSGNLRQIPTGGVWRSTAAIDQITLTPTSGDFLAGSHATLYGYE